MELIGVLSTCDSTQKSNVQSSLGLWDFAAESMSFHQIRTKKVFGHSSRQIKWKCECHWAHCVVLWQLQQHVVGQRGQWEDGRSCQGFSGGRNTKRRGQENCQRVHWLHQNFQWVVQCDVSVSKKAADFTENLPSFRLLFWVFWNRTAPSSLVEDLQHFYWSHYEA